MIRGSIGVNEHWHRMREAILAGADRPDDEHVAEAVAPAGTQQNEMLFFLKPECFIDTSRGNREALLDLVFSLFASFSVEPAGAVVLSGPELGRRKIMDRHYGFINRVSRSADTLSSEEKSSILANCNVGRDTPILGGHEFLANYPSYDHSALDALWASKKSLKARSGLYFQSYDVDGLEIVLLNGFHPAQLAHFTQPRSKIALIVLRSDLPWKVLRTYMLGDTFPERAAKGSLRRTLFETPSEFGLSNVSIAANAAHLSAGPFEAMFELSNFLGESPSAAFNLVSTATAKALLGLGATIPDLERALQNPCAVLGGKIQTLFDATEESDTLSACHLFRLCFSEEVQRGK